MRDSDDRTVDAAFEVAAGAAAVTFAAFAAAVLVPRADPAGRVLVVAIAVGLLAVVFSDWRACTAVAVIAALVFVGFLTHRYGVLTGDVTAWSFTPLIGFAVLLGRGYRRVAQPPVPAPAPADPPADALPVPPRPGPEGYRTQQDSAADRILAHRPA